MAWSHGHLDNGNEVEYGFGWEVEEAPNGRVLYHAGNWNGTSTGIARYPGSRITVIILSNIEDLQPIDVTDEVEKIFR